MTQNARDDGDGTSLRAQIFKISQGSMPPDLPAPSLSEGPPKISSMKPFIWISDETA